MMSVNQAASTIATTNFVPAKTGMLGCAEPDNVAFGMTSP
jgi:hypothetical protein